MLGIFRILFLVIMGFIALWYGYEWLVKKNGETEAILSIIGSLGLIIELLFNLIDRIFGDQGKPRLDFYNLGTSKQRTPSKNYIKQTITINWEYSLIIRNNSDFNAFNPTVYIKRNFSGVNFPGINKYKPDAIYLFQEQYLMPINNFNEREPIKAGEKAFIRINFSKQIQGTTDEAIEIMKKDIPIEMEKFELLIEYKNGNGNFFYTLIKRRHNKWENIDYLRKPLSYWGLMPMT